MSQDEAEDAASRMVLETIHTLVRQAAGLSKAIEKLVFLDTNAPNIVFTQQEIDEFHKRLSLYKDLESRIERHELNYYQATDLLGIMLRQFDHFHTLVQNLLGYFSGGQAPALRRILVQLEPLLQEVVDLFEYLAAERWIEVRLNLVGEPVLSIDRDLVRRMFINLLDNAIKYSYAGSEKTGKRFVSIECRRHSTYGDWIITFQSYGVGVDQEEIDSGYIFKYGTRGKFSGDRGRSGTGIGLAEARRIAEAHNGRLTIKSQRLEKETYITSVEVVLPDK